MGNVTAILRNFSSSTNNSKWEISSDSRIALNTLPVSFYANGNCKDNEGYVSVIFSKFQSIRDLPIQSILEDETRCYVSVVDAGGNKRFTQSLVFIRDQVAHLEEDEPIVLERYVKRETLLNSPVELLPADCLTICVDVDHRLDIDYRFEFNLPYDGKLFCLNKTSGQTCIYLDSDFGREICRVSEVFRRASDVPMMEGRTRMVPIPDEEEDPFQNIYNIFYKSEVPALSMSCICGLYRVADKYDIQPVIQTCKQFLKAFFRATDDPKFHEHAAESVPSILELAEDFRDDDLKEIVQTYLESKENFGTNYGALGKHLKVKLDTEWKCEFDDDLLYIWGLFTMRRRVIEPEFQFYQ